MSYADRLHRVQQILQQKGCDALLVEDGINLYYLTGLELSAGTLIVQESGAHLFVDNRYYELCKKRSPFPVVLIDQGVISDLLGHPECASIRNLGFNSESLSFKAYQEMENKLKGKVILVPLDNPMNSIRAIKDSDEIALLKEAADLGSKGFDFVCTLLKEGISEAEVARELEIFWKRLGSKGVAFDPIIAFGANSSMPHYRAGEAKLQRGEPVLIDIGVNLKHYHSDMTRVVFFGEPKQPMREIYDIVLQAQEAALKVCKPGTLIGEVDQAARGLIAAAGYGERFTHSIGHGIGLEIHEYPILRNKPPMKDVPLQIGMAITIEPGIYLPGVGGVRIEDTVIITGTGYENLTNRPKKKWTMVNGQ